jgi:hypothetical protein
MTTAVGLAQMAGLVADPARAAMLQALMAGEALTAGELARAAGIGAPAASAQIAHLVQGGLVAATAAGRHRYHVLASDDVARALEGVMVLAETAAPARAWRHGPALRAARTCWDHLAGQLGVAVHTALVSSASLVPSAGGWSLTEEGRRRFAVLGVATEGLRPGRRFACDCMDWSERRPHLAGTLAAALCRTCLDRGWLRRAGTEGLARRALHATPEGARVLRAALGVTLPACTSTSPA